MDHAGTALDLTVTEAASRLRVMPATLRGWIADGRIVAHKNASGHWRITAAEVERVRGVESPTTGGVRVVSPSQAAGA